MNARLLLPFFTAALVAQTAPPVVPPSEAVLAKVPEKLRGEARAFYRKTLDIQGLPVMAAASVSDEALVRTHEIVSHVLAGRPDILKAMATAGTRLLIIGKDQVYTDLPDYKDMPNPAFWNERVRGTGGDDVTSFGEENLLNLAQDRYDDMSVGLHEFAHTIDAILARIDPAWTKTLEARFRQAVSKGLFHKVYAGSNPAEYWAEGVTMYFDCERPNNWNHGPITTREALRRHDPGLYDLVKTTLRLTPAQDWKLRPLRKQPSITPPPPSLKADPAYVKFTLAREFPVLGTPKVRDEALLKANDTIRKLFAYRHDVLKALISEGARLVVLGQGERLSELPEFSGHRQDPAFDEVRLLEYDRTHHMIVVPEENVLGLPGDPMAGECATLNLFAKALHTATAQLPVDPTFGKSPETIQQYELHVQRLDVRFDQKLAQAFQAAQAQRRWHGTAAARDRVEYWAAGVTAYFDGGGDGQCPLGAERPITTRAALKAHDPRLYRLVDETFAYRGRVDWRFHPAAAQEGSR